ncbi:MAG: tRNA (adenosine(37)-N6)-threonylcarbamoyltransferase complex dimerization subunit type 1 TsaB [Bacteroidales bacterium]|nr:tRNA (adenosine(37)-N6)-threonylcarbamoyltransferase complex dimerization subunit type 1 TsaB [Bacteroidales bacterium]
MALILHIETATSLCSVALSRDGEVLFAACNDAGPSHAVQLGVYVDQALRVAEQAHLSLDAVAVSSGPGSYTGLRIGVSMAKGLCYALSVPLVAVPTLQVLTRAFLETRPAGSLDKEALLCPMIDARRMEVYTALFRSDLTPLSQTQALVVDEHCFSTLEGEAPLYIFGNGAAKCYPVIARRPLFYEADVKLTAQAMIRPAEEALAAGRTEDVAYFEPFYLKEFQATVPTKIKQILNKQ